MSVHGNIYLKSEIKEQKGLIHNLAKDKERLISIGVDGLNLGKVSHIQIIACGSSYNAGLLGTKYLEVASNIPVSIVMGSEFIFNHVKSQAKTLYIVISQSGETKDIIDSVKKLKESSSQILGISNKKNSTLSTLASPMLYLNCEEEKSIAATKTFTMTCLYLYLFSLSLSKNRGFLKAKLYEKKLSLIKNFSNNIERIFNLNDKVYSISKNLSSFKSLLCLGSGNDYPIVLESALKIREVCLVHAEGMTTGELKHGPMAMLDEKIHVLIFISDEEYYLRQKDLLKKIQATGAELTVLTTLNKFNISCDSLVQVPNSSQELNPLLINIAGQIITLHLGQILKRNVDEPRNLTKVIAM